jgi:hypothetical protein
MRKDQADGEAVMTAMTASSAWRVARAAEHLERVANGKSGATALDEAVEELKCATVEASAAIATRLGDVLRGH